MVNDPEKLKAWNWGAFLLAPLWALGNKLDCWGVLCFIPGINIAVALYLGFKGNRLAFPKSSYKSVDDFMQVQKEWAVWAVRVYLLAAVLLIVTLLV